MYDLQKEIKDLPEKPGVYIMKDESDNIIYIGKAKVLKNRVRQYFQNSANHSAKVKSMVKHIDHFEYIVTNSELEALILENSLIKKNTPKYNIMLKDDKTYPYIKVTTNEMFPRVFSTRQHVRDKAKYFGPFTSGIAVKENLELINKIWKLRKCRKVFPRDLHKDRPCLNYHIGQCSAPCNESISEEEYNKTVTQVLNFLSGKTDEIVHTLRDEMLKASANLEFERAAELRDTIASVKKLNEKQIIETMSSDNDRDVLSFARSGDEAVVQVFFIRGGKITGREHFMPENTGEMTDRELLTEFIKQFYSGTPYIPKEILLQCDIDDFDLISQWLSGLKQQRVNILIPQQGDRRRIVDMAHNNAAIVLERFGEQIKKEQKKTLGAIEEIKNILGIDFDLFRIESYDISNTQGFESVGSMVVFENGKPKRSDYRKFKIKSVVGPDDYASMYEVLTRRFTRYINETSGNEDVKRAGFDKLPNMIFMDGGKGQITAANKVFNELGLNVAVCGMVKDDRHRTRALLYNGEEINMPYNSEGFKLITRIQDEVHRFAIEYHRKLREKRQVHSILDDIPQIGEKRRKALMKHFGDINAVKNAGIEELKAVEGMNAQSAENVYNFFHGIN